MMDENQIPAGGLKHVDRHTHNGLDSPRIKYTDIEGAPALLSGGWQLIEKKEGPYGIAGTPIVFSGLSSYSMIRITGHADTNESNPEMFMTLDGASSNYGTQRLTVTGSTVTGYNGSSLVYISIFSGFAATGIPSTFEILIANHPSEAKSGHFQSGNSNNMIRQGSFTHSNASSPISTVEFNSSGVFDTNSIFWVEGIS